MSYVVTGEFDAGRGRNTFRREVDANSASHAEELAVSQLTSEHSISRANITVDGVEEA